MIHFKRHQTWTFCGKKIGKLSMHLWEHTNTSMSVYSSQGKKLVKSRNFFSVHTTMYFWLYWRLMLLSYFDRKLCPLHYGIICIKKFNFLAWKTLLKIQNLPIEETNKWAHFWLAFLPVLCTFFPRHWFLFCIHFSFS